MKKKILSFIMSLMLVFSTLGIIPSSPVKAATTAANDIKGSLVIVGGALAASNKQVNTKFIELAGGVEKAKIGIIPAASTSPVKTSNKFKDEMVSIYGVPAENIQIIPIAVKDDSSTKDVDESKWIENVNKTEVVSKIQGCTAIWFIGGDQSRITAALYEADGKNTKSLDAIWTIYKDGAVIGGTSAGCAIMSDPMFYDGDSLGALSNGFVDPDTDLSKYEFTPGVVTRGLGFFKYGIVDQHFDKRSRFGRLIAAAYEKGDRSQLAYGIDENTAMIVNNNNKTAEILGSGGVTVIDVSKTEKNEASKLTNLKNVNISYLNPGDTINLDTKALNIASSKLSTKGYEYYDFKSPAATGVFTGRGTLKSFLAFNLVDNAGNDSVKSYAYDSKGQGFQLTFKKVEGTDGYWEYKDGNIDNYSFKNVMLDIEPVTVGITPVVSTGTYVSRAGSNAPANIKDIKGSLVIVGGALGSSTADIYNKFIDLAKGKENAKIGIFPTASTSLKSSNAFKTDLINYGIPAENIEIIPIALKDDKSTKDVDESKWIDNVNKPEVADKIKAYTGIWFVGGDQTRITTALLNKDGSNTLALNAVWDMYKNGGVLGGTSAGAAIMSDIMLAGGDSLGALNEGFTETYSNSDQQEFGPAYLEKGLGFFKYGIVDQHFDGKARLGRLIVTAFEKGYKDQFAYGIDENTAMIVNNAEEKIEVLGKGGVTVVDLTKAVKNDKSAAADMKDIYISFIDKGDSFNLNTKEFAINPDKDITNGYEYGYYEPTAVTGLFSSHNLLKDFICYDLVDNELGKTVKSYCFDDNGKGSELQFKKTTDTKGYWAYTDGTMDDYSAVNVALDIKPIKVSINMDKAAPVITVTGVEEGKTYEGKAKPVVAVDDGEATVTMTLNEAQYNGGEITEVGTYKLVIKAVDKAGNTSTVAVNFIVKAAASGTGGELPQTGSSFDFNTALAAGFVCILFGAVIFAAKKREQN